MTEIIEGTAVASSLSRQTRLYSGSSMGSVPEMLMFPDMVVVKLPIQPPFARRFCYPGVRVLGSLILWLL